MADEERELAVELIAALIIHKRIVVVRGREVMLDANLAELYGVETGALTRAVRRGRFASPTTSCSSSRTTSGWP